MQTERPGGAGFAQPTLLVTSQLVRNAGGGREMLSALNHDLLREMYAEGLSVLELNRDPVKGWKRVVGAFAGHLDGINPVVIDEVVAQVERSEIECVFLDGSNLGELARALRKRFPKIRVITFFHNVEARFFLGALRNQWSLRALGVFLANALAERKAVRFSDDVICLSERDRALISSWYGRDNVEVSAIAVRDGRRSTQAQTIFGGEKYALFVGGPFYANLAGIEWFVDQVVPHIAIDVRVVGRGLEAYRQRLERSPRVKVIGSVESLGDWYANAHFVIAPIFDGSGMKTKVAEALMYGKKVVGSPEAFSGYEMVAGRSGWVCRTAGEFARAIEALRQLNLPAFDPELRGLYEANYSPRAALLRLGRVIDRPTGAWASQSANSRSQPGPR